MGYSNESASPNKYSGMKEYCEQKVTKKLSEVMKSSHKKSEEIKALKPPVPDFRPDLNHDNLTPVAAIDGGIATLFQHEVSETKLLKVALGVPPEWKGWFNQENLESYTHIFTGQLRWPDGTEQNFDDLVNEMIEIVVSNEIINKARKILQIPESDFRDAIFARAHRLKNKNNNTLKGFEDNIRELLEISAMVVFIEEQKNNNKILHHQQTLSLEIPYLFIKDGTLYPASMTVSKLIADKVTDFFNMGHPVIGVIKNSRFVNKENIWSKVIGDYAKEIKSHTFFRINKKIELSIDSESNDIPFRRYFVSLFGGESVYEVQIPKILSDDPDKLEFILTVLAHQITYNYGGSISTNSYAHEQASLPEVEARHLTEELRSDLRDALKEFNQQKKDKGGKND